MTATRWVITYLIAPILIIPGLFGLWGSEGTRAAWGILKFFLVIIAVLFFVFVASTGFK
jgi:hypothetical protein